LVIKRSRHYVVEQLPTLKVNTMSSNTNKISNKSPISYKFNHNA